MVVEVLQQPDLELLRVVHRQGGHGVKRTLRALAHHPGDLLQLAHHRVPAALVLVPDGGEICRSHIVQSGRGHLVDGRHAQTALGVLHGVGHQLLIPGNEAANARAAGGKALGNGVDNNDILRRVLKFTQRLQRLPGVHELPVGLVADDEQAMLLGNVHHHAHLLRGQHGAGGVAGVGTHNGPGMLVDLRLDLLAVGVVIPLLGLGGNGMDGRTAGADHGVIVGIKRLGNENLVPVVQNAVHGDLQGLGAAVGNENILRCKMHIQLGVVAADGLDELRHAGGRGILQHRLVEMLHRVKIGLGRLNVGLSDVQMIDLLAFFLGRHRIGMELAHGGKAALFHFR